MENVLIHLTECDKEFSAKLSTDESSLIKGILACMYKDETFADCVSAAFAIYIKDFDDRDGFIKLLLSASDGLDCKKKENKPKEDKKDKKENESEYERVFSIERKKIDDEYNFRVGSIQDELDIETCFCLCLEHNEDFRNSIIKAVSVYLDNHKL